VVKTGCRDRDLPGARTRVEHLSRASILGARALPPPLPRRVLPVRVACAAQPVATPRKTRRPWCCGMRSRYYGVRSSVRSRTGPTAVSSLRWYDCCPGTCLDHLLIHGERHLRTRPCRVREPLQPSPSSPKPIPSPAGTQPRRGHRHNCPDQPPDHRQRADQTTTTERALPEPWPAPAWARTAGALRAAAP
jgi:hypothetical protein